LLLRQRLTVRQLQLERAGERVTYLRDDSLDVALRD